MNCQQIILDDGAFYVELNVNSEASVAPGFLQRRCAFGPTTPGGYEMLRAAVNTAREHQCRSLPRLKEQLAAAWPDRAAEIDEALAYWSADIRRRHPNGVPRH